MTSTLEEQEDIPLPPIQTAVLDDTTLGRLFEDVAALGVSMEVIVKWAPSEQTPDGTSTLSEAQRALEEERAFGVQLRYPHQGSLWFDTLMRSPEGIRLVRIAHPLTR